MPLFFFDRVSVILSLETSSFSHVKYHGQGIRSFSLICWPSTSSDLPQPALSYLTTLVSIIVPHQPPRSTQGSMQRAPLSIGIISLQGTKIRRSSFFRYCGMLYTLGTSRSKAYTSMCAISWVFLPDLLPYFHLIDPQGSPGHTIGRHRTHKRTASHSGASPPLRISTRRFSQNCRIRVRDEKPEPRQRRTVHSRRQKEIGGGDAEGVQPPAE